METDFLFALFFNSVYGAPLKNYYKNLNEMISGSRTVPRLCNQVMSKSLYDSRNPCKDGKMRIIELV